MKSNIELDRRTVLGTVGSLAVAGSGLAALTGSTAAHSTTDVSGHETISGSNDDGEVQFVAYGGKLKHTWDGLDTEAMYGKYSLEVRIHDEESGWTKWRSIGSDTGPLGTGDWGGDNDFSEAGTEGKFVFHYGSEFGQEDYAIAYNDNVANNPGNYGPNGLRLVGDSNKFDLSYFEEDEDDSTETTHVEFSYTCVALDSDKNPIKGAKDSATARLTVEMTNEPAESDTGNQISGVMGDAE